MRRRKRAERTRTFVKCPKFIKHDTESGAVGEILCKVCGTAIAGISLMPGPVKTDRNGVIIQMIHRQFIRFSNYTELKIAFKDGSAHVTNGCNQCLTSSLTVGQLKELYEADIDHEPSGFTEKQIARRTDRVAAVANNTGGIT